MVNFSAFTLDHFSTFVDRHRGGVYFEVGYAMGREVPVIWCCRKDHLKDLHFDVRQFNSIDWQTPEELRARLQVRIEATIGDGPLKTALA